MPIPLGHAHNSPSSVRGNNAFGSHSWIHLWGQYTAVTASPPAGTLLVIAALLIFSPSQPGTSGLDLLAATASAADTPSAPPAHLASSPLLSKDPFNPAASLPAKVVKRILELEFVEMAELMIHPLVPTDSQLQHVRQSRTYLSGLSSILLWLNYCAAVFHTKPKNSLHTRQQSYGLNETLRELSGLHTTARIGAKHWPART